IAPGEFALERSNVIKRNSRVPFIHQRTKTFGETVAAHQRQGPETQSMKRAFERDDPFPAGRSTGKFQRSLHCFRARVAKKDSVQVAWGAFCDRFCKQSAQKRAIHLHHVRKIEIEDITDGLLHDRMITADVENGIAAEEIEIGGVIHIIQISAFRSGIDSVETDYALGGDEGSINVPMMQLVIFTQPCRDDFL